MAKEIWGVYTPGATNLYAVLMINFQAYNGSAFEDMLTANWNGYDLPLTEQDSTGYYYADMPAGLPAGLYSYVLYQRVGVTPAPTDNRFGGPAVIEWSGSVDISRASLLAHGDQYWVTAVGFSTLTQTDIRDAVGLASANLDTQLAALAAYAVSILDDTGNNGVVVASASKSGYTLAASGLDGIEIESGVNLRQATTIIASALSGLLSGMGTGTITIKGMNSATTRIEATHDENNNRTAVTLTLPG